MIRVLCLSTHRGKGFQNTSSSSDFVQYLFVKMITKQKSTYKTADSKPNFIGIKKNQK